MTKCIEREAAMLTPVLPKTHRQYQTDNLDDAYECGWYDALSNLKNLPAADVVPVVRCPHGRLAQCAAGVRYAGQYREAGTAVP